MRLILSLMIASLLLTSCASPSYKAVQSSQKATYPVLIKWSKDQQNKAANELEACGNNCEMVARLIDGYKKLRNKIRIARGEKMP